MSLLRVLRDRLRALGRPQRVHDDINDELRFHMEMRTADNVRRGMTPDDARRDAHRSFGHVSYVKELAYDVRGGGWAESMWQDLRYAARGLRARPAFALGVTLTLGIGIGANAAMFGIVDRLLVRPPSYLRDPGSLHRVYLTTTTDGSTRTTGSTRFPRYMDVQRFSHAFASVIAFATRDVAVGEGENARERPVTVASASYFDLFDMRPALGRFFTADDDRTPRGAPVVVLGYAYWQSEYAGRDDVIGQIIRVGRTRCTIVGVAPAGFTGVSDQGVPAMYLPLTTFAWDQRGTDVRPGYDYTTNYGWVWLELVARRRPNVGVETANADLTQAFRQSYRAQGAAGAPLPASFDLTRVSAKLGPLQSARGPRGGPETNVVVWVTGISIIVLLIAGANVANLLLARAVTRRREIALRLALGVSRGRLFRQLVTESFVLAVLGGLLGLALAQWGGGVLGALFLQPGVATAVVTDARTLGFAFVVTIAVALFTGLAPLSQALRYRLAPTLHSGGRDAGGQSSRVRTALLLLQAMLSVVLLVGAGLFVRSLEHVRAARLGFDVDPLLVVNEHWRSGTRADEQIALERRLVDEARRIPGVVSATQSPSVPYTDFEGREIWVSGVDSITQMGQFYMQTGNAEFFRTYGARIVRGRAFDDRDGTGAARVVVVSDRMAARLWPGRDPIGQCMYISSRTGPCATVIGVAEEMQINSLKQAGAPNALDAGTPNYTYSVPIGQFDGPAERLVVRVSGDGKDYAETVRRRLQRLMPGDAYLTVVPLRQNLDPEMQSWRTGATMFVAFAALALAVAAVGLYSVMAYAVVQRRREIGVRIALGASRPSVVRLVVTGGVRLVLAGAALGIFVAWGAARWVAPLLFQQSPTDPIIYAEVAGVMVVVALLATALPALAASRVDPNVALRAE